MIPKMRAEGPLRAAKSGQEMKMLNMIQNDRTDAISVIYTDSSKSAGVRLERRTPARKGTTHGGVYLIFDILQHLFVFFVVLPAILFHLGQPFLLFRLSFLHTGANHDTTRRSFRRCGVPEFLFGCHEDIRDRMLFTQTREV